jgi:CubicO group peptidase (beta-lactamase class C family)
MLRRTFLAQVSAALNQARVEDAFRLMDDVTRSGSVEAACLSVRRGSSVLRHSSGSAKSADAVFLLASITKPVTATGLMILADRREISLSDPVQKFIPEFRGGDRKMVTIRHLLTHTSGLPDMLPENEALRRRHAPLPDFVAGTCKTPLLFRPGTECRYQSMGILLAAEIAQRVTRTPFPEFLRREVFRPLGLGRSSLGLGGRKISETAQCQVSGDDDWNWNSPYWRNLAAPWGGAHATADDVARFFQWFLAPEGTLLKPDTAASMIVNQNAGLKDAFGIGFRVAPGDFGKACSDRTFGHWGSTGTVAWADPATGLSMALLTTKPAAESRKPVLVPVCDSVSRAVL